MSTETSVLKLCFWKRSRVSGLAACDPGFLALPPDPGFLALPPGALVPGGRVCKSVGPPLYVT